MGMAINYKICPQCGSKNALKIIYGYPSHELFEEAEQGKVMLGGCCISEDSPEFACRDCNKQWSRKEVVETSFKSITKIKAFVGGYFGSNYNVEIDFVNLRVFWAEGFNEEIQLVKNITHTEAEDFVFKLQFTNLLNWKSKYVDIDILDGTQWSIDIETDKRKIHLYGSNKLPKTWIMFYSLIEDFIGKPFA
jgi:hypothetical protein